MNTEIKFVSKKGKATYFFTSTYTGLRKGDVVTNGGIKYVVEDAVMEVAPVGNYCKWVITCMEVTW